MIFVDANVLIDLVTDNSGWREWSQTKLDAAILDGEVAATDIVYAEVSLTYETAEQTSDFFDAAGIKVLGPPREALFLAGKAFRSYRRNGGVRTGVLPDFLIGAHAAVLSVPLLTRDTKRYRTYFPSVELIAP